MFSIRSPGLSRRSNSQSYRNKKYAESSVQVPFGHGLNSGEVVKLQEQIKVFLLKMTMKLSQRTPGLTLFRHLLEIGQISASVIAILQEEDSTRVGGTVTAGLKFLSSLS